ncbi:hypothetical protein [Kordia jejudonensis]|uniref:hypothetical protein n=1 Tax=Kordia jejudonensis TaxID=1348245 RepID=UPI0012E06BC7|nr:hypothetical protein [Kordia jejudonensis]
MLVYPKEINAQPHIKAQLYVPDITFYNRQYATAIPVIKIPVIKNPLNVSSSLI